MIQWNNERVTKWKPNQFILSFILHLLYTKDISKEFHALILPHLLRLFTPVSDLGISATHI